MLGHGARGLASNQSDCGAWQRNEVPAIFYSAAMRPSRSSVYLKPASSCVTLTDGHSLMSILKMSTATVLPRTLFERFKLVKRPDHLVALGA
jgi:hypothetical protein